MLFHHLLTQIPSCDLQNSDFIILQHNRTLVWAQMGHQCLLLFCVSDRQMYRFPLIYFDAKTPNLRLQKSSQTVVCASVSMFHWPQRYTCSDVSEWDRWTLWFGGCWSKPTCDLGFDGWKDCRLESVRREVNRGMKCRSNRVERHEQPSAPTVPNRSGQNYTPTVCSFQNWKVKMLLDLDNKIS